MQLTHHTNIPCHKFTILGATEYFHWMPQELPMKKEAVTVVVPSADL